MFQQPAANHVSDNSYCASTLPHLSKVIQNKKSGIPTTIYYPAVFTTNATLSCMLFFFVVVKEACLY